MCNFLENTTLHERQMKFYNGSHCIYCGNMTELVSSLEVYQQDYGLIYLCRKCNAYVNCHTGNDQSFGCVGKKELRDLRHKCHILFDPIWNLKITSGISKRKAQAQGRKWLASKLNIEVVEMHFGMCDEQRCKQVIEICEQWYSYSKEQSKIRESKRKLNTDVVYFLMGYLGTYTAQEFKVGGLHQITLTHTLTGKILNYKPVQDEGSHPDIKKGKWFKIENIESYIEEHFK